jgi:hypothetical protein
LDAVSLNAGHYYYLVFNADHETEFHNCWGSSGDFANVMLNSAATSNGDDCYAIYDGTNNIDVYGEIGTDGTGETWEFLDSYSISKDGRVISSSFSDADWDIDGANSLDGKDAAGIGAAVALGTVTLSDPTPVQLTSFTASAVSGGVMLNWATATEIDNYGFEVECSVDGNVWKAIAFVEGHGNSNTPQEYSYFDNSAAGNVSYRLKQLDNNGAYEYSAVVSANAGLAKTELLQNSPNPFNPSTKINFVLADNGQVNISVYNMLGQKVAELVNGNMTAGNHTVNFNASDLASGFYFYTLKTAGYSKTMKMMLIK